MDMDLLLDFGHAIAIANWRFAFAASAAVSAPSPL